jgi:putative DNA primase/helicase
VATVPADPARVFAQVAEAEIIAVAGDHLNADRFLAEHGDRVRYSPELGRWLVWNGAWWQEDRLEAVHDLAGQTIDRLRSWVGEARTDAEFKRRTKHYNESTRSGRRDGMLAMARCRRSVVVSVAQLDRHRHLLACRNGTVDLRTGELLEADPAHLITRGVAVDHVPDTTSTEWSDFLNTIFNNNTEMIDYARRLMGYSITGEVGEHLLPIFNGTGANGKTQFITAIMAPLAEHAAMAPEGLLVEAKHEQHPERLATLRGKRLIVSSELEHRAVLAESLVKSITGGDRISARHLYGQRFDFEPSHTVVLVTNHAPKVHGTDEAIWRRLRMVPFTVTIPAGDRIPDYGRILAEQHGEAIVAWLVAGAVEWYRDGLGEAEPVRQATFDYRKREDVFQHYLEECTITISGRTKVKDLQAVWREWAKASGVSVGRNQDFADWLEAHGIELETYQGARFARGLGILSKSPGSDDPVRTREDSSGNSAHTYTREEVYGREVTSPHENGKRPGSDSAGRFDLGGDAHLGDRDHRGVEAPPLTDEDIARLDEHEEPIW